jgi:fructuronate reductase
MRRRLNSAALADLPAAIARPLYDRAGLTPGIVHLGLGAFARAHLAAYTEDALNAGARDWGILGVNLNSPKAENALKSQDGLYTLLTRGADGSRAQVIGAVLGVLTASRDLEAVLDALASPSTRIVSLTITEKGYCLDAATGALDERHPLIAADLAEPTQPRSAPGLLVEALSLRRATGVAPFTVLSLDNLAHNGAKTRAAVVGFAALRDPELGRFVESQVAFPSTMVDRITPATSEADSADVSDLLGLEDAWPVVAEPFRQWVVEDRFPLGRPAWRLGGALFADNVEPFEVMKLRCLNGAHSTLAYLSVVAGVETIAEAMTAPGFSELIGRLWRSDMLPTLPPVAGVDLTNYTGELERRFRNPAIRHRTIQISADGSQKLPQRLVGPALELLRRGVSPKVIPLSIAAWMRFLVGRTEGGESYEIADPLGERLTALARDNAGSAAAMVDALLAVREIFPPELANHRSFRAAVTLRLGALQERGVGAEVAATLGEG